MRWLGRSVSGQSPIGGGSVKAVRCVGPPTWNAQRGEGSLVTYSRVTCRGARPQLRNAGWCAQRQRVAREPALGARPPRRIHRIPGRRPLLTLLRPVCCHDDDVGAHLVCTCSALLSPRCGPLRGWCSQHVLASRPHACESGVLLAPHGPSPRQTGTVQVLATPPQQQQQRVYLACAWVGRGRRRRPHSRRGPLVRRLIILRHLTPAELAAVSGRGVDMSDAPRWPCGVAPLDQRAAQVPGHKGSL